MNLIKKIRFLEYKNSLFYLISWDLRINLMDTKSSSTYLHNIANDLSSDVNSCFFSLSFFHNFFKNYNNYKKCIIQSRLFSIFFYFYFILFETNNNFQKTFLNRAFLNIFIIFYSLVKFAANLLFFIIL